MIRPEPGKGNPAPEFRFINLFRALAAFWVLVAHVQIWGGYRFIDLPNPKVAVDLFMLVSGFLMVAMTADRWEREPLTDAKARGRFWIRRFFRIAPAYYLALLVVVLGADVFLAGKTALQDLNPAQWASGKYSVAGIEHGPLNLLAHVTFVFGLFPQYATATSLPDWSISLEMQFYLAFPALALLLRRWGVVALVGLALAVYVLIGDLGMGYPAPSFLGMKMHLFVAGMLLHGALMAPRVAVRVGTLVLALGLTTLGHWAVPWLLLAMYATGVIELSGDDPLRRFIDSRAVRYASDVSYSVYLFQGFFVGAFGYACLHSPWLRALSLAERTALLMAVAGIGVYALGGVIHRYVELPGIALGRRVLRTRDIPCTSPCAP